MERVRCGRWNEGSDVTERTALLVPVSSTSEPEVEVEVVVVVESLLPLSTTTCDGGQST